MKIHEYVTAAAETTNELDEIVNRLIREGYQPHGSPYYVEPAVGTGPLFCQAMVKTEPARSQEKA